MAVGFPRSARMRARGARQVRATRQYQSHLQRFYRVQRRTSIVPAGCMVSSHLVDRWIANVAPGISRHEAGAQVMTFLAGAFLVNETDSGGFYLGHPSWPDWVIVLRKTDLGWVAKTTIYRRNAEGTV